MVGATGSTYQLTSATSCFPFSVKVYRGRFRLSLATSWINAPVLSSRRRATSAGRLILLTLGLTGPGHIRPMIGHAPGRRSGYAVPR